MTPEDAAHEVATLRVARPGRVDPGAIYDLLEEPGWLGEPAAGPDVPEGAHRLLMDLVLPLPPDGRLLKLRKAALVDVGPVLRVPGEGEAAIAWRSATLAPLFPVFAGRILVAASGLSIEGTYAPPGGAVGMAADRVLLNVAARGTARWLLDHVAARAGEVTEDRRSPT
jgi:hypothetical protein